MRKLKKLPIGIQSFETMREQEFLYIDKTKDIFRLVDEGMFYFLSRPRRFGKSLLVSTLRCLFLGQQELFKGLWIDDYGEWEWQPHPVVLIDFNGLSFESTEELQISLKEHLAEIANQFEVQLTSSLLKGQLKQLVLALHQKTGMPVAILIDEYDKPIIDHLGKGDVALEIAKANRDLLKNFFGVLKDSDISPKLRFVFLTGISKFSKVSIFSELNNLNDISMTIAFVTMLGYTQEECQTYFSEYIEAFAQTLSCSPHDILQKLTEYYNGYRFSKSPNKVYNPFAILKAFAEMDFGNYWFETGTPSFLINILQEQHYPLPQIENLSVDESSFRSYEIEHLNPEAILFQTGYVTIKHYDDDLFTLAYPNREVKQAFLRHLYFAVSGNPQRKDSSQILKLSQFLRQEAFDAFFETIEAIFASIPYSLNTRQDEAYFHTMFYLMVSASGASSRNEVLTSRGRIDLEVEFPEKAFLIEFKCDQNAKAAIKQIQDKGYADKFKASSKKVILLGINFGTEQRNVKEWKVSFCSK